MLSCGWAAALGDSREAFRYETLNRKIYNWSRSHELAYKNGSSDPWVGLQKINSGSNPSEISWYHDDVIKLGNDGCFAQTVFEEKLVDLLDLTEMQATSTWTHLATNVHPNSVKNSLDDY